MLYTIIGTKNYHNVVKFLLWQPIMSVFCDRGYSGLRFFLRCRHALQSFEGGFLQCLAMVGMCDFDQFVGALAQSFSEQVGNTLFSDNVMDVGAGRDYAGTWE